MKGIFGFMVISLLNAVIHCDPPPCPELKTCDCFWNVGTIRCRGTELTGADLNAYGKNLTEQWNTLIIENTNIVSITNGTFSNVEFRRISIQSNKNLTDIDTEVFKPSDFTVDILIKNNPKFVFSNAVKIMSSFPSITNVELNENNITDLKQNSFSNLSKLEAIYLDKQKSTGMKIQSSAFNNLTNLKQLNLNGNALNLSSGAIDLSVTVDPGKDELLIYLNETHLDLSSIDPKAIIPPKNINSTKFMVFLNDNTLTTLKDGLISNLAAKGFVYLSQTNITCVCTDVTSISSLLKANQTSNHIQGIYYKHLCKKTVNSTDTDTAIIECPTTTPTTPTTTPTTTPATTPAIRL